MGAEDAVDDVDVVERADGVVQGAGMLGRFHGGELVEEFVVGPGFLGEEVGQDAHGCDSGREGRSTKIVALCAYSMPEKCWTAPEHGLIKKVILKTLN